MATKTPRALESKEKSLIMFYQKWEMCFFSSALRPAGLCTSAHHIKVTGFEPMALCTQNRCADQTALHLVSPSEAYRSTRSIKTRTELAHPFFLPFARLEVDSNHWHKDFQSFALTSRYFLSLLLVMRASFTPWTTFLKYVLFIE